MKNSITDYFETLSTDEIYQETPGKWSDSDLLDALQLFDESDDLKRKTAILELVFASPDNSEIIGYDELYFDLIQNPYLSQKNFTKAIYWTVAALAYEIQHDNHSVTVRNLQRTLAEIYLLDEDFEAGIQIVTRLLQTDPGDLWTHNLLALVLPKIKQPHIAIIALERALELAKESDPEDLTPQLQEFYEELTATEITAVSIPISIQPDTSAKFHEALRLPPLPKGTEPEKYLPPITNLLSQGDAVDEALHQTIITQWKALIPELLQVAFDEDYWGTAVNRHAISLLHQIHEKESALDSLTHWLDQANGENWHELLSEYIGKIGGFTTLELKTIISNTNLDTFVRSSAAEELTKRLETMPEQRDEIINYCRLLLTRQEAYEADEEMFIALLIASSTDQDAKELYPEIKKVFDEDRINPTITDLSYVHEQWGMSPLPPENDKKDGIYAILECTKCHRTRIHFVQHVTTDMTSLNAQLEGQKVPYDPHIMDHPIICPKCGAIDQYKTDLMTSMRLAMGNNMENMLARLMGGKSANTDTHDPFVTKVHPKAFGQDMHPFVALNKYKQIAINNPKDADPHWRMGNILRMIWRDEQAREAYQRSIDLDPKKLYSYYCLATTEHDLGNLDEAKILYQKTMKLISPMEMMSDEELMSISMSAAEGLKALENGLPSPYAQEFRMPKEEPKLNRKERRAQKKRMRKMNKKKRR